MNSYQLIDMIETALIYLESYNSVLREGLERELNGD